MSSIEDLNKLHAMWPSRGAASNIPISLATLNTFKQYSRLIHYCYTPLLFLPSWRLQSAATRDHSVTPPPQYFTSNSQDRSRTASDASAKKAVSEWHKEICDVMINEYIQYLQVLGFNLIQLDIPQKTYVSTFLKLTLYVIM